MHKIPDVEKSEEWLAPEKNFGATKEHKQQPITSATLT